jgi:hypothetical protein
MPSTYTALQLKEALRDQRHACAEAVINLKPMYMPIGDTPNTHIVITKAAAHAACINAIITTDITIIG